MSGWVSLGAAVEGGPPGLTPALRDFWEDRSGPHPDGRVLHLRAGELPPLAPGVTRQHLPLTGQTVAVWRSGDELWLADALHLRVTAGGATLTFTPLAGHPDALELWSLALTEAHRAGGWLPLHAALIVREGRAVALSGVSGAGKSTAALRLLAGGWSVLAEDRAFWHAPTGQVAGLDRSLRAFPDSVERFAPALLPQALAGPRDARGKLLLPLPPVHAEATLSAVLLFAGGHGPDLPPPALTPPTFTPPPLAPTRRVQALWELTGVPLTTRARTEVQAGVSRLLPLLSARPVTRDTVLARVRELLES